MKYFLLIVTLLFSLFIYPQSNEDKFVVVLDAGHGGKDPGRPTKFAKEKDIALNVVLKLGEALQKEKDIKVIYTRKTDVFIELKERGAIANRADADLFISIHCNAHESQAIGTETYVLGSKAEKTNFNVAKAENEVIFMEENYEKNYKGYDPNSLESLIGLTFLQEDYLDQSILLAKYVEDNFKNKLKRVSRGVKSGAFIVLHQTYMPSILIETGFLTNTSEGKYLSSKNGQNKITNAIKDAVLKYKSNLNASYSVVNGTNKTKTKPKKLLIKSSGVTYRVQIAAGPNKIETKPYNFKGLKNVSRVKFDKGYKYQYGSTESYVEALKLKKEAKQKGYKNCFIASYKDGKRIEIH